MRLLKRNLTKFYYLTYKGMSNDIDSFGYETGERNVEYSSPIEANGNIADSGGQLQINLFGSEFNCDKLIMIDDLTANINEHTVFFIDEQPKYDDSDTPLYNYKVKKIKKTINFIAIAVDKVSL